MQKGSESVIIGTKEPGDIWPLHGDLMPAQDRTQAAGFTVPQTSISDA
jgi:hypothetical protein